MATAQMQGSGFEIHDPRLSDEANAALTDGVRHVLDDEATHHRADGIWSPTAGSGRMRSRYMAAGFDARILVVPVALMLIVVALVPAVGSDYALALIPFAGMVIGVILVADLIVHMTRETEHVSPETAALLENEGIVDPDRLFGALLAEHRPAS